MYKLKPLNSSILKNLGVFGLLLAGLWMTSRQNYLLFHSLAELFSIVVAVSIFILIWNVRAFLTQSYLLFLGIAYLFIAGFDLLHTLSYSGMGVMTGYGTNLPTQLWIIARYLESLTLALAPLVASRRPSATGLFLAFGLISGLILAMIFVWDVFPACYVDGQGLTVFKKTSEYIICLILILALVLLRRRRSTIERQVLLLLAGSIVLTIFSEVSFTLYSTPFGMINKIGHVLKILSFYLIYRAIVVTGLQKPYTLLFRQLRQREADLKESQERFRLAIDHYPHVFVIYDASRRIQYINAVGVRISGKAEHEILGRLDEEINPPDVTASYLPLLQRAIRTRMTQSEDCAIKVPSGTFTFHITYVPVLDDSGHIRQILGITQDMTLRKKIESEREQLLETIRAQSVFQERLLDEAPIGIAVVSGPEHRYEMVNAYYQKIPGTVSEPMVGRTIAEVFPRVAATGATGLVDQVYHLRQTVSIREYEAFVGPGRERTYWNVDHVPLMEGEQVERVLIIAAEITGQVLAKKAAEAQVARDKAIMDCMTEGLLIVEMESRAMEMSPAAEAMYRKDGGDGARVLTDIAELIDFRTLAGGPVSEDQRPMTRVMRGESFSKYELCVVPTNGSQAWFASFNGTPIHDRNGKQVFSLITIRDVTEEKEAENVLKSSHDLLERKVSERTAQLVKVNQDLEEFTYIASHDLQEPLRKIQTFSDRLVTMYGQNLDAKATDYLSRMNKAAGRMRKLINALLAYSRITTREAAFEQVDLAQVLADVIEDLEDLIHRRNGRVEVTNLGSIQADRHQMQQLFQNLIHNGLKFNDRHEPVVRINGDLLAADATQPSKVNWYRITVSDNGIGIEEALIHEIFKPFQRLHGTTKYQGTGIGLAICHKIIQRHGGRLEVTSRIGEGSTFAIDLPVKQG